MAVALRPPYSSGQLTAAHRPSFSSRCHAARRCWDCSPDSDESSAELLAFEEGGEVLVEPRHAIPRRTARLRGPGRSPRAEDSPRERLRSCRHPAVPIPRWSVDFTFDAEQLALQDVARRAMDEVDGALLRRLADDDAGFTPELWDRLVSLGWTSMLIPGEGAGPPRDVHRPRADGPGAAARPVLLLGGGGHAGRPGARGAGPPGGAGRRGDPGDRGGAGAGPRRPAGHGPDPGRPQGGRMGAARGQADGGRRAHGRLGHRGRSGGGRDPVLPGP